MKSVINVIILGVLFTLSGCQTDAKRSQYFSESDKEKYANVFNDLRIGLEEENGELWNHQLYGPLMLADRETRAIIANEGDNAGFLEKNDDLFTGVLPDELNIANTAFEWNGKRWTIVALPLPQDKYEQINLLTHELFHRIQPEVGFANLKMETCDHLDSRNGRIYLILELNALKKALESEDSSQQGAHLRDALLFRSFRYELYPDAKVKENMLELNEGLAEYTGSILSGRSDSLLRQHYIRNIDALMEQPTFVSSFAYRTIPVYGYFLKKKDNKWNLRVSSETNLTDFIADSYSFTVPDNLEGIVDSIRNNYNYAYIEQTETKREEKKKALLALLDSRFRDNPVLVIPLQNMNISYNPGTLIPYRDIGTVYPTLRVTDNWGVLSVEKGALVSKNWNKVVVTEPLKFTDTISGNGWKLILNDGWKIEKDGNNFILRD